MLPSPNPLPYHRAVVEHLRGTEPALWNWFTTSRQGATEADAVRLDLLKSTYRLDRETQPKLHGLADSVRERMKLTCGVALYQSQLGTESNAALAYLPNEAHIIFSGSLTSALSETELRALLAHELGHFALYELNANEFLIASDLLRALAIDPAAGPVASESARLFRLWTELYADRWACHVCEDANAAIAVLLKTTTGLADVNADSYLKQAEEIFAKGTAATAEVTHPEPYIRARALRLWVEKGDEAQPEIERMIAGGLNLHQLDLLGQRRAADLTRWFLQALLAPPWFRSEAVIGHTRRFFPDFAVGSTVPNDNVLTRELDGCDASLHDYLIYLTLDFLTADRDLGDPAIAAALVLARKLGFAMRFAELVQKELGLGKKAFAKLDRDADSLLANAAIE